MDGRVGGGLVDRAEEAAGAVLDDLDRATAPAADVGEVGGAFAAGPVPGLRPAAAEQLRGFQLRQQVRRRRAEEVQVLFGEREFGRRRAQVGARTYGLSGSRTVDSTGWSKRASGWWTRKVSRGRRGRSGSRARPGRSVRRGPPAATGRRGCRGSRRSGRRPTRRRRCRVRGRWWRRGRATRPSGGRVRGRGVPREGSRRGRRRPGGPGSGRPRRGVPGRSARSARRPSATVRRPPSGRPGRRGRSAGRRSRRWPCGERVRPSRRGVR